MKTRSFLGLALAAVCSLSSILRAGDFPTGSPEFITNYEALLAKQKVTGKPAVVIFSATWCGPCQSMKQKVYPSAAVKPFHDKFLWAYLDADDSHNKKAQETFAVNGIPHIEFLNPAGKSIGQQVGSSSPKDFSKKLEEVLTKAGPAAEKKGASPS